MSNREKPSMKTVIEFIGKFGPLETDQLKLMLPMSETAIYKACKSGVDEGYLRVDRAKKKGVCGRRHCIYTRTDKPYIAPQVCHKTIINRIYRERMLTMDKVPDNRVVPFRHWMDSALFGSYPTPIEPQIKEGRIYRQPMNVRDDEELAA
ncbi:hypothetical protein BZM27_05895 [Paraburkholderia steynii]|uniref:Uncharacterized protein n=1 Tax=Paraburkholderia steynii TaxID=1245441 RepID=A0A4R0XJ11_9BURK|nr:hypothetical protein BZM27_05895 [Paraburkholderia steynii]